MALTIVEAAKLNPGDVIRTAIVEMYARNSDILRVLPFDNIAGNALKYNREDILPGVGFRGVDYGPPGRVSARGQPRELLEHLSEKISSQADRETGGRFND